MTVKEMMAVTNLSRKTITEKVKQFYPEIVQNGKSIYLNEDQAIKVMEDLRKKGFITPAQNSQVPAQNSQALTVNDIPSIVAETIKQLMPLLQSNQNVKPMQKSLPGIPQLSSREQIVKLINKMALKEDKNYQKIWGVLYEECYYRLHTNYTVRANNAGMGTLEYIDNIGECEKVLAIAKELFEAV